MRLVTAHVPNTPGILAKISEVLAEAELDVQGFSADANRIRVLTDTAPAAVKALEAIGIAATEHRILKVDLADRPGALADLTRRFADADINIELAFGATDNGHGTLYLRVDDHAKAQSLLAEALI